jgi:hypothetical protein
LQAPDGCLHAVFGPSRGSVDRTGGGSPYTRAVGPQAPMARKAAGPGQEPLGELAKRLCVNP